MHIRQTHAAIDARREERRRTSEERRYSYSNPSQIPNAFDYPRPPRPLNTYSLSRCTRGTQTAQLMFTCGIDTCGAGATFCHKVHPFLPSASFVTAAVSSCPQPLSFLSQGAPVFSLPPASSPLFSRLAHSRLSFFRQFLHRFLVIRASFCFFFSASFSTVFSSSVLVSATVCTLLAFPQSPLLRIAFAQNFAEAS